MDEPSVLDYLLDKLTFWREKKVELPPAEKEPSASDDGEGKPRRAFVDRIWIPFLPLILAVVAQFFLEPDGRSVVLGILLYLLSTASVVVLVREKVWNIPDIPTSSEDELRDDIRLLPLFLGMFFALAAFWLFSGNRFTVLNVFVWAVAFFFMVRAFWLPAGWWQGVEDRWHRFRLQGLHISPWTVVLLLVFAVTAFYRFYALRQVPPEMFSDHAEKLLDVGDVLWGRTRIFFPRNTGREAFQMYLTAAVSKVFGTGLSFLSLKLGTTLAGFFTLPYIYLLGKEYMNRRVGLFALFLAGVAYWPNVISRVALRFTFYPFFAAPALYYFIRGLKYRRRNDFIFSGVALGLGLHGYSPFRIVPLILVALGILYFLHHRSKDGLQRAVIAILVVGLISLVLFLPLFRFAVDHYQVFSYRTRTRMTDFERSFPGPAWKIFLSNTLKALVMFQWDNGEVWVHSIPHRPALGVISGALFTLGVVIVLARYLQHKHWLDLLMLLLIPLFLLTSILSLAYPNENPSLNRTGAAIIPVFIIAGVALETLFSTLKKRFPPRWAPRVSWALVGILFVFVALQNATLVFDEYEQQFLKKSWNTSEIGRVIDGFNDTLGEDDHAWVVPYPHWVDTRLVGIRAGRPHKDYALWREDIPSTKEIPGPKLFIVKPEDKETMEVLVSTYPAGLEKKYQSMVPGRDFLMYYVFPAESDR